MERCIIKIMQHQLCGEINVGLSHKCECFEHAGQGNKIQVRCYVWGNKLSTILKLSYIKFIIKPDSSQLRLMYLIFTSRYLLKQRLKNSHVQQFWLES